MRKIPIVCSFPVLAARPKPDTIFKRPSRRRMESLSPRIPLASNIGFDILKKGAMCRGRRHRHTTRAGGRLPGAGNIEGRFYGRPFFQRSSRPWTSSKKCRAEPVRICMRDSTGKARTDWSQNGHLACGVPGTIAGMFAAHKYGKLPFRDLIQPAIDLAENGFILSESEAGSLNGTREAFLKYNTGPIAFVRDQPAGHPGTEGPGRYAASDPGQGRQGFL